MTGGQGEGRQGDKERGDVWRRQNFVIKIVCYEN
jgi:hypothetical protein